MGNPISNFISKFAKAPKRSIGKGEIGATGTKIFSGIIDEEFNPNLRSLEAVKVYDRMRKSDAQVFASLQAVKLPLLSATWYIEPAKGDDINETEAQDQADFITKNLFKDLKWNRQLKRILTYLDFGFKYLEKVFGIDEDGKIVWIKWGDRQQNAHYAWENDSGKKGALQQLPSCEGDYNPFTPMEKLLVFSYQIFS